MKSGIEESGNHMRVDTNEIEFGEEEIGEEENKNKIEVI